MHVYDAARSFVTCLEANTDVVSGEIFNVGSYSLNHRLSEVAEKIAQIVPGMETEHVENTDRRDYRVSFDKIHTRLGFVCQKTLDDGIRELYDLVQTGRIEDFTVEQFNNRAVVATFARTAEAERSSLRCLEALAHYE
jgi:nucleoside-diphosphate-sugar epimerase